LYGEWLILNYRVFAALALTGGIAAAQGLQPSQQSDQSDDQSGTSRYAGPSILSRDRSLIGERSGKLLDYSFYVDLTGSWDSSLIPVSTTSTGALNSIGGTAGISVGYGVTGSRTWRHDKLSVDYTGDFREFPAASYFDGTDQFLNLSYWHEFSRRLSLRARDTAGVSSYSNGYFSYLPLQSTDLYAVPTNELFDNRTEFVQSRVDLTYQKTLRLSFDIGGEGFLIDRRSTALASVTGYNAHADVSYRLTSRQTVTLSYEHTTFSYKRQFGDANMDQGTLGYSIGLGRRWDFASQIGSARVDFSGLTSINLDPAIAAILGQSTAVVAFHSVSYIPIYEAQLTRRFEHSAVTGAYNQSFSPGNGIYLTSRQTAASLNYSYTGLRKLSFGANAAYSRLTSLGQTLGTFNGISGGAGLTYTLASYAHLEFRYDYRHYTANDDIYKQNSQRVVIGFAFSPGQKPLPIW
jgi:hypothetical protein